MSDTNGRDRLQSKVECLGAIIVVGLIFLALQLGVAWAKEGARVVGPENVTAQYDAVISDWQELISTADNACTVQDQAEKAEGDPTLVENTTTAYQATYRRVRTDYNSRMQNIFKAKKVGPPGYPKVVPDIPETRGPDADWCVVSEKLLEYHE